MIFSTDSSGFEICTPFCHSLLTSHFVPINSDQQMNFCCRQIVAFKNQITILTSIFDCCRSCITIFMVAFTTYFMQSDGLQCSVSNCKPAISLQQNQSKTSFNNLICLVRLFLNHLLYVYDCNGKFYDTHVLGMGHTMMQLIEALSYKLEGCRFNFRWCHWNFSLTESFCLHHGLGVN
jgi:hypothetical protein